MKLKLLFLAASLTLPGVTATVANVSIDVNRASGLASVIDWTTSIDLDEARHPQTILAYDLNGKPVPVANGAPLRLRVERQLGYKHAKYLRAIELVESFASIRGGKGGYWEDEGYEWWAGI